MARVYRVEGGRWAVDYRDGRGGRVRRVVASTAKTGRLILAELVRNSELCRAGLAPAMCRIDSVWELWTEFEAYLEGRGGSPLTLRNYRSSVPRVLRGIGAQVLGDVTLDRIDGWKTDRRVGGARAGTVNLELRQVRRMFAWAVRRGLLQANPLQYMEGVRGAGRERGVLELGEIELLLAVSGWLRPVWVTFLLTGLRSFELRELVWDDVDLGRELLRVRGKGGRVEYVPICEELLCVVNGLRDVLAFRARGRDRRRVFLNAWGRPWASTLLIRFRACCARAGIDWRGRGLDVHGLRRTYGTMLAADPENDVRTVMSLMRHRKVGMTMELYARPRAHRLDAAAARLGRIVAGRGEESRPTARVGGGRGRRYSGRK